MIILVPKIEKIVQVDDYTLIDFTRSIISDETLITFKIKPEASASFIDVSSDFKLGYAYSTDGTKVISIEVETDVQTLNKDFTVEVITKENDLLFSDDADLLAHEDDILSYLSEARKSFLDRHRVAQDTILDTLDHKQVYKMNGDKLEKTDLADIKEVWQWSKYLTLAMIFENLSNQVEDVFALKAKKYGEKASFYSERSQIRLKYEPNEVKNYDLGSGKLIRG
jgi:hypothetical protein